MLFQIFTSNGQTIILAENYSGFTTGSHTLPSTNDVSSSLDLKTSAPGWRGNLIYSAGGEVKIGTSSNPGWIETPEVDLSSADGNYKIAFDIARWPGDASTVQVCLDGITMGSIITPLDNYDRKEITLGSGTSSSRIRIQALTKRFFIDNLTLTYENVPTSAGETPEGQDDIRLWPLPARQELNIVNTGNYEKLIIIDINGRVRKNISVNGEVSLRIDVSKFDPGFYLFSFISGKTRKFVKVIKQ